MLLFMGIGLFVLVAAAWYWFGGRPAPPAEAD